MPSPAVGNAPGKSAAVESCSISLIVCFVWLEIGAEIRGKEKGLSASAWIAEAE